MSGTLTLDGIPPLRIPAGAEAGYIAVSDQFGNVTWAPSAAGQLGPADHGLIAWNFTPYNIRATDKTAMTTATLYVAKIPVPRAAVISKIGYYVAQASAVPTAGQCFAGLFGPTGTLLGATADQSANFGTLGSYLPSLISPRPVSAGYVYAGFFYNGTGTALALGVGDATSPVLNFGLTNATSLWATANTGLTTAMPASLGTLTSVSDGIWACVA